MLNKDKILIGGCTETMYHLTYKDNNWEEGRSVIKNDASWNCFLAHKHSNIYFTTSQNHLFI